MDLDRRRRADRLLERALDWVPGERSSRLAEACAGDRELEGLVRQLVDLAESSPGEPWLERSGRSSPPTRLVRALVADVRTRSLVARGTRIGPYRVLDELGRGGMGVVYRAERSDGHFRQTVALKLLPRGGETRDAIGRFERERQILADLVHPNIAHLLDGGLTSEGVPYFAMEYVEGPSLVDHCDAHRLSLDARIRLFLVAARAVDFANSRLVAHGDLKPAHLRVTRTAGVKLLDFGIARLVSDEGEPGAAGTRSRLLTPEYASPEQMLGQPLTLASDVYQLGLVLYELLTGRKAQPVVGSSREALERAVCQLEPGRPSSRWRGGEAERHARARSTTPAGVRRQLRGDLDEIVGMALRKDPERRYRSVGRLIDDLERYQRRKPVRARPGTWAYRTGKLVARHRVGLAAGLAIVAAVAWALATVARQQLEAAREADRAAHMEEVLGNLLSLPNPRAANRPPEARDYADHASRLLLRELAAQPRSQARLLTQAGRLYNALGLYEPSIAVLGRALEIRRHLGRAGFETGASLETAETLEALAQSQHYASRYQAAETSLRRALGIFRARLGDGHPATLAAAVELGDLLHTRGRLGDAEGVLRRTIVDLRGRADTRALHGRALRDLANVLRDRGALHEAGTTYRAAIRVLREVHGDPSQPVAVAELYFGRLLILLGKLSEAEALLTGSLAELRAIYDGDHPLTGTALRNLGDLRTEQGRFAEAQAHLEEALGVYRHWLGAEHGMSARSEGARARLDLRRGCPGEAAHRARSALARFAGLGIPEHPMALEARRTLGQALSALGRPAEAVSQLAHCLAAEERLYVAGDPRAAATRAALAEARARTAGPAPAPGSGPVPVSDPDHVVTCGGFP